MKKLILGAALLLCLASCSYRVYPVGTLADNYELSMQTPEELAAKESVTIYLSENEVPGPYKLLAFVENRPILPVAIASQQLKNFYKQAVLKAYEMGGNAIIVESIRSFKVIQVSGLPPRKSAPQGMMSGRVAPPTRSRPESGTESARPAPHQSVVRSQPAPRRETTVTSEPAPKQETSIKSKPETSVRTESAPKREPRVKPEPAPKRERPVRSEPAPKKETPREPVITTQAQPVLPASDDENPIFDESTAQWFTSGYVYRAKEQEQIEIVETMNDEILSNLQICKTVEEANCISAKIDLLEKYNQALPIPSGTQTGKIKAYRNSLEKIRIGMVNAQQAGSAAKARTETQTQSKPQAQTQAKVQKTKKAKTKSGTDVIDDAVQSVKGFFKKLKK